MSDHLYFANMHLNLQLISTREIMSLQLGVSHSLYFAALHAMQV